MRALGFFCSPGGAVFRLSVRAMSGHRLVHCTCLLLTQSGRSPPNFAWDAPSGRAARHDANGSKRVNGLAMLVEGCPFDPSDALRFCLRRREFDHLTFEVKLIARAHRGEPPQSVNAKA